MVPGYQLGLFFSAVPERLLKFQKESAFPFLRIPIGVLAGLRAELAGEDLLLTAIKEEVRGSIGYRFGCLERRQNHYRTLRLVSIYTN